MDSSLRYRVKGTDKVSLFRIEGVVVPYIYSCIGILTHDLLALREPAVEYSLSF
jgi:hypothetical protein